MAGKIDWDAPVLEIIAALERDMDRRMAREERRASRLIDVEVAAVLAVEDALRRRGMRLSPEDFSRHVDAVLERNKHRVG